jgi:hypothetical protein
MGIFKQLFSPPKSQIQAPAAPTLSDEQIQAKALEERRKQRSLRTKQTLLTGAGGIAETENLARKTLLG